MRYEIRNKNIEAAHPVFNSECTVRKMTDDEKRKYGPINRKKGKAINIRGFCGWGHNMVIERE